MKMLQAITDAANAQKHSESEKVIRKAVKKVTRMATSVM